MFFGAAGEAGKTDGVSSGSGVWRTVLFLPFAVVDRAISLAKICVASQAIVTTGDVLTQLLHTVRHTTEQAGDVVQEMGVAVRYGFAYHAAARLTSMLASSARYAPFLLM